MHEHNIAINLSNDVNGDKSKYQNYAWGANKIWIKQRP